MSGEADEADPALLLCGDKRFGNTVGREYQIRVVVVDHLVNLPEVEMIGLKTSKRFFEHPQGDFSIAAVSADFRHQKDLIAPPFQSFAHALFAEPVVVFPGIVEKRHAVVDGFGDNLIGGLVGFGGAQMIAAQSHGRNFPPKPSAEILASERPNFRKDIVPLEVCGKDLTSDCYWNGWYLGDFGCSYVGVG
jgi:hypothetical protein